MTDDQIKTKRKMNPLSLSLDLCPGIFFHWRRRFLDFFHGLNKFWCGPFFKLGLRPTRVAQVALAQKVDPPH